MVRSAGLTICASRASVTEMSALPPIWGRESPVRTRRISSVLVATLATGPLAMGTTSAAGTHASAIGGTLVAPLDFGIARDTALTASGPHTPGEVKLFWA